MKSVWKLFWDILSVLVGLYFGYKVLLFSGAHIPMFGYFPIGLILGLFVLGITVKLVYFCDLFLCWIIWKITGIEMEDNLPF